MINRKENQITVINEHTAETHKTRTTCKGIDILTEMYLDRLTRTVCALSALPDGNAYTHIIGNDQEDSNQDAIETLIINILDDLNQLPFTQHLDRIMQELNEKFHKLHYLKKLH
jgi:hypothetical protein